MKTKKKKNAQGEGIDSGAGNNPIRIAYHVGDTNFFLFVWQMCRLTLSLIKIKWMRAT